jgi:hypothetical protein
VRGCNPYSLIVDLLDVSTIAGEETDPVARLVACAGAVCSVEKKGP